MPFVTTAASKGRWCGTLHDAQLGNRARRPGRDVFGFDARIVVGYGSTFLPQFLGLCCCTLGFLIHDLWAGRKSSMLGVWAAPAAPETIQKYGGLRPPYF